MVDTDTESALMVDTVDMVPALMVAMVDTDTAAMARGPLMPSPRLRLDMVAMDTLVDMVDMVAALMAVMVATTVDTEDMDTMDEHSSKVKNKILVSSEYKTMNLKKTI